MIESPFEVVSTASAPTDNDRRTIYRLPLRREKVLMPNNRRNCPSLVKFYRSLSSPLQQSATGGRDCHPGIDVFATIPVWPARRFARSGTDCAPRAGAWRSGRAGRLAPRDPPRPAALATLKRQCRHGLSAGFDNRSHPPSLHRRTSHCSRAAARRPSVIAANIAGVCGQVLANDRVSPGFAGFAGQARRHGGGDFKYLVFKYKLEVQYHHVQAVRGEIANSRRKLARFQRRIADKSRP